jgi:hypothetical protein
MTLYNELNKPNPLKIISQTVLKVTGVLALAPKTLVPTACLHTLKGRRDQNLNGHKLKLRLKLDQAY